MPDSTENYVPVHLSAIDVIHLCAGGSLVLDEAGVVLHPASDLFRIANPVRTRVNGGRRRVLPRKEQQ